LIHWSPLKLLTEDEETAADKIRNYWSEDPVHMVSEGYTELVDALMKLLTTATFNRQVETAGGSGRGIENGNNG
jgi:hypothetical protein